MKRYQTLAKISMLIVLGALIVLFTGCKDEEEGTASLSVSLESFNVARTTYDAVNIDIQSASIHTLTNADETSGWFELPTYTGIYDLLDYEAGNDTIIALEPFLELQTVSQIRLILGHENTIVVDGMTYDLDTPSAQSSGLKIQIHADLQPNMAYKVVLNFDVDKSIVNTGNNKYKLLPVINASVAQVQ